MEDDLDADIQGAVKELNGAPPVVEAPVAPVIPAETHNAVVEDVGGDLNGETPEQKQARIDATGRAHDEKGKFTAKPADKNALPPVKTDASTQPKTDADKPLTPPSHWKADAKAEFLNAPRKLQEYLLAREKDMEDGRKEWSTKAEDYNAIQKVIAPNLDRWARAGMTPATAINQLLAAERELQKDPLSGTVYLLRAYASGRELQVINEIAKQAGYQLTKATNQGTPPAQGEGAQPPAAQPQPIDLDQHPTVRRLNETIQSLTQEREKQREAETQTAVQNMHAEITRFAAEPEHVYFENVRPAVAALVANMEARGDNRPIREQLAEAYEQAVWADPATRPIMLAEQAKKAQQDAAAKAAAARNAAVSVIGSPGDGAPSAPPKSRLKNLDDDILADINAARESVRA